MARYPFEALRQSVVPKVGHRSAVAISDRWRGHPTRDPSLPFCCVAAPVSVHLQLLSSVLLMVACSLPVPFRARQAVVVINLVDDGSTCPQIDSFQALRCPKPFSRPPPAVQRTDPFDVPNRLRVLRKAATCHIESDQNPRHRTPIPEVATTMRLRIYAEPQQRGGHGCVLSADLDCIGTLSAPQDCFPAGCADGYVVAQYAQGLSCYS